MSFLISSVDSSMWTMIRFPMTGNETGSETLGWPSRTTMELYRSINHCLLSMVYKMCPHGKFVIFNIFNKIR